MGESQEHSKLSNYLDLGQSSLFYVFLGSVLVVYDTYLGKCRPKKVHRSQNNTSKYRMHRGEFYAKLGCGILVHLWTGYP